MTPESGSFNAAAVAAPIPTATAGVVSNPGRCAAASPAAAPRKIAGKIGPPRNPASETE